jgi:hypothetical protein
MFVCISNSVATKNGNNEGITLVANSCKPFFTAGKFAFENTSKPTVNARNNNGIMFLFNFITNMCMIFILHIILLAKYINSSKLSPKAFEPIYIWDDSLKGKISNTYGYNINPGNKWV